MNPAANISRPQAEPHQPTPSPSTEPPHRKVLYATKPANATATSTPSSLPPPNAEQPIAPTPSPLSPPIAGQAATSTISTLSTGHSCTLLPQPSGPAPSTKISVPLPDERLRELCSGSSVLSLYGGLEDRPDGLAHHCRPFGITVVVIDLLNGEDHNVADDLIWDQLCQREDEDEFAGGLLQPPCRTFSTARERRSGEHKGPPRLRGEHSPEL